MTQESARAGDHTTSRALGRDTVSGPLFELQDVSKAYEGRIVLSIGRLQIQHGETLAIVGPSGAGKTTLLKLLAMVEQPSTGCIQFLGGTTAGLNTPIELRRRIVMVFQRPMLLSRSVTANVGYGLRLRRVADNGLLVPSLLRDFGLDGLGRRLATTLSGGEQQRVAVARALAIEPDVLLLDEPTAHLDPANVTQIEQRLHRLTEERKTTIVLATHNIFQARRLAARVALLLDGRLVEIAETSRFFESPADAQTAAFLRGEMVY